MLNRRSLLAMSALLAAGTIQTGEAQEATTGSWRQIGGSNAPSPRWDHTLSADSDRKRLIVALGRDNAGTSLGDSFVADRSTGDWEPITSAGPAARFGHAVAVDRERGKLFLFGGENADVFFNDLWALDLETLTWEQIDDGSSAPTPRYGTSLVFDGDAGLFVSHGFTFEGRFDDTWRFDVDGGGWEDVSPDPATRPLRRCLHEAVWSGETSSMWMYGGCSSGYGPCPQGDLWEFKDGVWTERTAAGPPARTNPSLVVDEATSSLVLFAGQTEAGRSSDLWTGAPGSDGLAWTQVASEDGPSPRSSHDAVYSAGAIYLFGGYTDAGAANDLWRLKLED